MPGTEKVVFSDEDFRVVKHESSHPVDDDSFWIEESMGSTWFPVKQSGWEVEFDSLDKAQEWIEQQRRQEIEMVGAATDKTSQWAEEIYEALCSELDDSFGPTDAVRSHPDYDTMTKEERKEVTEKLNQLIDSDGVSLGAEVAEAGKKEEERIEKWLSDQQSFGGAPDAAWANGPVLYSYNTVIAKRDKDVLYLNETKYSKTTTKLTRFLERKADLVAIKQPSAPGGKWWARGLKVEKKPESFFKTSMPYKLDWGREKQRQIGGVGESMEAESIVVAAMEKILKPGDQVSHKKFGEGVVCVLVSDQAVVAFRSELPDGVIRTVDHLVPVKELKEPKTEKTKVKASEDSTFPLELDFHEDGVGVSVMQNGEPLVTLYDDAYGHAFERLSNSDCEAFEDWLLANAKKLSASGDGFYTPEEVDKALGNKLDVV
jgi:hypothetical protein